MIAALVVVAAVLVQVVVVNRLALPGGGVPDLVLLAVIGAALLRGPAAGAVIGFCAGLVIDVMPPVAHVAGQYAFVLAVVGYVAGRGAGGPVSTVVLCVLMAPLVAAAVGGLIGDPRVTLPALFARAPIVIVYTLIAAPAVVWLATRRRTLEYVT
ncbi:rod shape-determining protein MreD [Nonomuraea sediminis]|uniref:rod shape-determining protein MreD n=1 Tax=Nonomuraea sediminis TaxID=2835864 RepID=UPI001BDD5F14|nr:rod shape-determining protein MreD [Nonomuraea sediminis]